MLAMAVAAGWWAEASRSLRSAALVAGAVVVFALVSYGMGEVRQSGAVAPSTLTVSGQPYSIAHGRFFVFFFDPECMHCFDAARRMAQLDWGATRVVAVPVEQPQYAPQFLSDTGLKALVSTDFERLKQVFHYTSYPFGVGIEDGRETAPVTKFDDPEPAATLKHLGLVK